MSWAKFDDQYFRHKKIVTAGRDARDMHMACILHCCEFLTDGVVGREYLRRIHADSEVERPLADLVPWMIECRLLDDIDGILTVHNFLKYNPTKEKVEQTREARKEAGRRGGDMKASNLLGNLVSKTPTPYPVSRIPVSGDPFPDSPHKDSACASAYDDEPAEKGEPSMFSEFMSIYPKNSDRKEALSQWWKSCPNVQVGGRVIVGLRSQLSAGVFEVEYQFIPLAKNYLKDERWKDPLPPPSKNGRHPVKPLPFDAWMLQYGKEEGLSEEQLNNVDWAPLIKSGRVKR